MNEKKYDDEGTKVALSGFIVYDIPLRNLFVCRTLSYVGNYTNNCVSDSYSRQPINQERHGDRAKRSTTRSATPRGPLGSQRKITELPWSIKDQHLQKRTALSTRPSKPKPHSTDRCTCNRSQYAVRDSQNSLAE